ncbi:mechanosensitive ion channel family protein [Tropicimonas isoalkanivorans]|uniref:Small-conductance mechanosensitive channel n=1 Tax=Tropicimonas isoalkanivorans TaxID=441112 RepID=A0A1I1FVR3_9RHOB|nr:mechanosensitive ion channel family protein [Tropicimonas isoalkanivorans]SFC03112.1 small conductance mechanosensitive channel [Tropicimonas isoalkanivorans]
MKIKGALLRALSIVFLLALPGAVAAQDTPSGDSQGSEASQPADASGDATASDAAAAEPAQEEDAAPTYPEQLADPNIPMQALQLRLLPLTAEQLAVLAGDWQSIIQEQTQAVVDATLAAEAGDGQTSEAELERIVELKETRGKSFTRFEAVLGSWEKKGGNADEIAAMRAYKSAISVQEAQQASWRALARLAANWATSEEGGIQLATRIAVVLVSILALVLIARLVRGYSRRLLTRVPDLSKLLQSFLALVAYWVTIAIGLMIVLSALGVDITPLFAVVGGASFIIAFAMQDTLGNLAAGLMIMINRPFDEGDYITAGGTSGTVQSVSVVSTTVTTPDNQVIVIPNSKVWGDVITNVTASATRRVDLVFGIGYDDSIEEAQTVLEDVVTAHPLVLSDPPPVIRVNELADSSVNFIVRPWARSADYWTVVWDLTRSVKEAFDDKGISIPFPQTDMHVRVTDPTSVAGLTALGLAEPAGPGKGRPEGAKDYASGDDGGSEDESERS